MMSTVFSRVVATSHQGSPWRIGITAFSDLTESRNHGITAFSEITAF